MYCPWCGRENPDTNHLCNECGQNLRPEPGRPHPYDQGRQAGPHPQAARAPSGMPPVYQPQYPYEYRESDDTISKVIPSKNTFAMIAYYMAVFSLIPGIGMLLGLGAFFCGLAGLREYRKKPEIHGKAHSWVGIILGGITGWGSVILLIWWISVLASSPHRYY